MENKEETEIIDNERLKWIAFFHYVSGGITIAFSLLFLIYISFFGFVAFNADFANNAHAADSKQVFAIMKIVFGVFAAFTLFGIIYGICEIASGTFIKKRKNRIFSMVVAIPRVLNIPYGTILSIFTLTMLGQPSVKEQYEKAKNARQVAQDVNA